MKYKAVIFDLDGVLVSTDKYHYLAWKKMADEEGIYFDEKINMRLRGVSRLASLEIILENAKKKYSEKEKVELAERKNRYYVAMIDLLSSNDILEGVEEFLSFLNEKGIKTAIGSSSKNAVKILDKTGLINRFDAIADGTQIKNSKPHPEIFVLAASKLSLNVGDCLVIEDAEAGVQAARNAGMKVLAVGAACHCGFSDYSAEKLSDKKIIDIFKN